MMTIHNHSLDCEACRDDRQHITDLEAQVRALTPFPLCLICRASEPCELDKEETSPPMPEGVRWPGSPCTFDPTPQQVWDRCRELEAQAKTLTEERDAWKTGYNTLFFKWEPLRQRLAAKDEALREI